MAQPSPSDIDYAEEQISEARRRLDAVRERVVESKSHLLARVNADGELEVIEDNEQLSEYTEDDDTQIVRIGGANKVTGDLVESHIQNIIIDCQLCTEIAVKSMFKLTGMDHPFSHSISFTDGRTHGFYHEIPDEYDRKSHIPRVIFLTQFWGGFYELAKYGAPELNMRPESIFTVDDGNRAINDAEVCVKEAEHLLNYVKEANA